MSRRISNAHLENLFGEVVRAASQFDGVPASAWYLNTGESDPGFPRQQWRIVDGSEVVAHLGYTRGEAFNALLAMQAILNAMLKY